MASFFDFTFECLYHLNQYFRSFWPVKLLFRSHLKPPSHDTEVKVLRIIHLLKHKKAPQEASIVQLVQDLPDDEEILCVKEKAQSYNILQLAVINQQKDLVVLLLKRQYNCLQLKCSPPVHLAASLGYEGILEILLRNSVGSGNIAGVCYPNQHLPVKYDRWLGMVDKAVYRCQQFQSLPIYFAVAQDHITCVKMLMKDMEESGISLPPPAHLLHFACRKGAAQCIEYFVKKYPKEVNTLDSEKDTPLLAAVVWGRKCVKILIENGAEPKQVSKSGETALHRLYRNDIDGIFTIFDTTNFLLTTGVEQMINEVNHAGETPLHVLVTHVSYVGGSVLHHEQGEGHRPRPDMQISYQNQVIETLDLLLKYNANPHEKNPNDLTPLNKLFHVAVKSCQLAECQPMCVKSSISSYYTYKNEFGYVKQAVEILLKHGSDPNTQCDVGHTPFILLLICLREMNVSDICAQHTSIKEIAESLLRGGASSNFHYGEGGTCSTILAEIASRYFDLAKSHYAGHDSELLENYSDFVNDLLEILLRHGLDPNFKTEKKSQHLKGGCGNALIDFVRLAERASDTKDFAVINKWLVTLFQWGANPDLEPYPSEPIICHSQSSIFLKKQGTQALSHYVYEVKEFDNLFQDGNAQGLLMLFYNTMSHQILYDCLNNARFMARFHPLGATGYDLVKMLTQLGENPRSLKEMARVTIYTAINRDVALKVPKLPLPNPLKRYLLDIE